MTLSHKASKRQQAPRAAPRPTDHARARAKRTRIIEAAMRHFAERGYLAARVEDIAEEMGIAKGSVFQHFGSKSELFLETYRTAVRSLPSYLDAPTAVLEKGFFETVRYWLECTDHLVREDWIPYRVALLGNYGVDLSLKHQINRFLAQEDPYAIRAFVRFGVERGEVRSDIDSEMIISILDWTVERFQDALVTEELDPGLFRHEEESLEKRQARIHQFLDVLRGAIGAREPALPSGAST